MSRDAGCHLMARWSGAHRYLVEDRKDGAMRNVGIPLKAWRTDFLAVGRPGFG